MIVHWDDVEPTHESEGTIEFDGYDLGEAVGTVEVGVTRACETRKAVVAGPGRDLGGLTMLAYGQRHSNDLVYYPRSNKIDFRGVGLIARLDPVRYEEARSRSTEKRRSAGRLE